ncbi:MAG: substrate-binding domain-containing protein [Theionarchaea archaeon]|nr:substrate-binding domain-containing protein [Theionarchaea archaeon]
MSRIESHVRKEKFSEKKGKKIGIMVICVLLLLPGCTGPAENTITISGAWALYPLMVTWAEEYCALHPSIRIDVSAGGAGKGMADVLGGLTDMGMVSRKIYPEEIAKGAFYVAVAKDAVIPIMNKNNPHLSHILSTGISRDTFCELYISGSISTWGDVLGMQSITDTIQLYTRSDACGAAQTWALYLDHAQEDLRGVGVYGDPGIVEAVGRDIFGIGFANLNFAYDAASGVPAPGVVAVPIDFNENGVIDDHENFYSDKSQVMNAIVAGWYSSPPARELYLVTNGYPSGLTRDFLLWILTEGQKYVEETGYISLGTKIQTELEKIGGHS